MTVDLFFGDLVRETSTTTGTGTLSLSPVTGFQSFVGAGAGGKQVYYAIIGLDGSGDPTGERETGIGTVTNGSPDTLARTLVLTSSNSDAAVDFSSASLDIRLSALANGLDPAPANAKTGCLIRMSGTHSVADDTNVNIPFAGSDDWDPRGWHDPTTDNDRVVPDVPGIYCVVVSYAFPYDAGGGYRNVSIAVNDGAANTYAAYRIPQVPASDATFITPITRVPCDGDTDYIYAFSKQTSGSSLSCGGTTRASGSMHVWWSGPLAA